MLLDRQSPWRLRLGVPVAYQAERYGFRHRELVALADQKERGARIVSLDHLPVCRAIKAAIRGPGLVDADVPSIGLGAWCGSCRDATASR